jgi:hypothetical protein
MFRALASYHPFSSAACCVDSDCGFVSWVPWLCCFQLLTKRRKMALFEALEKVKSGNF